MTTENVDNRLESVARCTFEWVEVRGPKVRNALDFQQLLDESCRSWGGNAEAIADFLRSGPVLSQKRGRGRTRGIRQMRERAADAMKETMHMIETCAYSMMLFYL